MIIRDGEGRGLGFLRGADVKGWIFGKLYRPSGWGDAAKVSPRARQSHHSDAC